MGYRLPYRLVIAGFLPATFFHDFVEWGAWEPNLGD